MLWLDGDNAADDGLDGIRAAGDIYLGDFNLGFSVLPGDFNGDRVVNSQDLVGIRNQMLGISVPISVWADVDGNGVVDILDFNAARKKIGRTV